MTVSIPTWKDCPNCIKIGMPEQHRQGMCLEEDYVYPNGNPRYPPARRYRCQDCDYTEEAYDPKERFEEQMALGDAWYFAHMHREAEKL